MAVSSESKLQKAGMEPKDDTVMLVTFMENSNFTEQQDTSRDLWTVFCWFCVLVCFFQVSQGSERAMQGMSAVVVSEGFISCSPLLLKGLRRHIPDKKVMVWKSDCSMSVQSLEGANT